MRTVMPFLSASLSLRAVTPRIASLRSNACFLIAFFLVRSRSPSMMLLASMGSTVVTSNMPFDEWTSVFGSERLTGALLDRLTHHVHILEMNGDSYRLNQSKRRSRRASSDPPADWVLLSSGCR